MHIYPPSPRTLIRIRMTRFPDPLTTAWEQSNPHWTLFNVAIYPLVQWSLPPWTRRNSPQDSASLEHPLGLTCHWNFGPEKNGPRTTFSMKNWSPRTDSAGKNSPTLKSLVPQAST